MRTIALLSLALALPVSGQVAPVGPFTGTHQEEFETQSGMSGFQPCVIGGVFQGLGDLCTPGAAGAHITTGRGFQCSLSPHGGSKFHGSGGVTQGYCEYTFASPVSRFGDYFTSNGGVADATLFFYDAADSLLGSQIATFPGTCFWTWHGWQDVSGAGIARVEVHGNTSSGGYVMMDDMEADIVLPDFAGSPPSLSNAAGGTQTLFLNAGPAHAGKTYLILGTLAGDSPGLLVDGLTVPVNFDNYTYFCIAAPNQPPLSSSLAQLEPGGKSQASFTIPPMAHPQLPGMTAHHAYLVFGFGAGGAPVVQFASQSVPLLFTP
jgi:hypothetical protein